MKPIVLLIAATWPAWAAAQTLAPQERRIDDQTIQADHATYESVQGRIQALNDGGRRVADYHLAKAQCWLDASFHEYMRNDRSAFPQAALDESAALVRAMEGGASPLPAATSLVDGADRLRPDLWSRFEALKGLAPARFRCAARSTACGEVMLVHAGHERRQQGWRHARPSLQIAEDLADEAERAVQACAAAPAAAAAAPVATPSPQPLRVEPVVTARSR